jgi:hypothetical protein
MFQLGKEYLPNYTRPTELEGNHVRERILRLGPHTGKGLAL